MRDDALACIRAIGVETGGSNIQFAVDPGRPHGRDRDEPARVALSALASKATGFPIAKIAALLAVGYRSTRSRTTSPARRPRRSSRRSTTWS
jgi:carbamoyl-phosphate synthase large subunit